MACAACSAGVSAAPAVRIEQPSLASALLGTGDVIDVKVQQDAEMSGLYRVDNDGSIRFPYLGKVVVAEKNTAQIAAALTAGLGGGYIKTPHVAVTIKEYNSKKVYVFGQVTKPGVLPYAEDMTIMGAISLAGGVTKSAAPNRTSLTRNQGPQKSKLSVRIEDIERGETQNIVLQPGDIIYIPESLF